MLELEYCEYMTGLPPKFYDLLVTIESTGNYIEMFTDAEVEVDWGEGKFLKYEPGVIYGRQAYPHSAHPIVLRSVEEVTILRFGSGSGYDREYHEIDVLKAIHLVDAHKLCYRLEELQKFTFFGNNKIENFESAWEDCTELREFHGMDTTRAITFKKAWKHCNKLVKFPNIYATECLTVEEAWMGCTAMIDFPIIDVANCENFASAWRGNVAMKHFPYIDTQSGINFSRAWSYCTAVTYLPQLNFAKAENLDYTFSYMKRVSNMPTVYSPECDSWLSTFRQMCALKCIEGVDTTGILAEEQTKDMFLHTFSLISPSQDERDDIQGGARYENADSCYYDAGRSVFFVRLKTIQHYCTDVSFTIEGGDFEIDWGDGQFLHYNEGFVSDIPVDTKGILIRSEEHIRKITIHDDAYTNIEFKRAYTVQDFEGICHNFKNLEYFEILGHTDAHHYDDMLNGCSNLEHVGQLNLEYVKTIDRIFKNCYKLLDVGMRYTDTTTNITYYDDINIYKVSSAIEMFYGCESIRRIQEIHSPQCVDFTRAFANAVKLQCLDAIDTRETIRNSDMFANTPLLFRPTRGELADIVAIPGIAYNNGGNCGGPTAIIFTSNDNSVDTTFMLDGECEVDWGDGVFVGYPANIAITGKPTGTVTIIGDSTTIDWQTDTLQNVEFYSVENFKTIAGMFQGLTNIRSFSFHARSPVEDFTDAFAQSGLVTFVPPEDLVHGEIFTGMFEDTATLRKVGPMNTLNGREFEAMFKNSGIQCLDEINTMRADFPPSYVGCTDMLDCSTGLVECFAHSTMFDGANPISPSTGEVKQIIFRYHFIGGGLC